MLRYTANPALEPIQGLALSSHGYDHLLLPSFVKNSSTMEKSLAFSSSTNYIPPYVHRDDRKRIRSKRTLVLDSSRGEIVNAPLKAVMKSEANAEEDDGAEEQEQEQEQEERALVASKIHSEAERRRRERINLHLATLRTILPASFKVKLNKMIHNLTSLCTCLSVCVIVVRRMAMILELQMAKTETFTEFAK
jgi:hypothetical protein